MYRIDSATAGPGGSWRGSDPATGQIPTQFTPEWVQMLQETVLHPIEAVGLSPSTSDIGQLTAAIQGLSFTDTNLLDNPYMRLISRKPLSSLRQTSGLASSMTYRIDRFLFSADAALDYHVDLKTILTGVPHPLPGFQGEAAGGIFRNVIVQGDTTETAGLLLSGDPDAIRVSGNAGSGNLLIRQVVPRHDAARGGNIHASVAMRTLSGTQDFVIRIRTWNNMSGSGAVQETISSATLTATTTWQNFTFNGILSQDDDVQYVEWVVEIVGMTGATPEVELTAANLAWGSSTGALPVLRPYWLDQFRCARFYENSSIGIGALASGGADVLMLGRRPTAGQLLEIYGPPARSIVPKRISNLSVNIFSPDGTADAFDWVELQGGGNSGTNHGVNAGSFGFHVNHGLTSIVASSALAGTDSLLEVRLAWEIDADCYPSS